MFKYNCVICQKIKLRFERLINQKVKRANFASNISYNKKTKHKIRLINVVLV